MIAFAVIESCDKLPPLHSYIPSAVVSRSGEFWSLMVICIGFWSAVDLRKLLRLIGGVHYRFVVLAEDIIHIREAIYMLAPQCVIIMLF